MLRNAARVTETLGKLKGLPMKLGQMISLHEGLLPPEVVQVLSALQAKAPSVPFETLREHMRAEIGDNFDLIEHLDPEPYASASIGQVHRARLKDGRDVVLKSQYPGIDKVIEADMKNLRGLLTSLFSMFTKANLEPVWEELHTILLQELDYELEARHIARMRENFADESSLVLPVVIPELTSRRVICMEFLAGISPEDACSEEYPAELRNKWGLALAELTLQSFLKHRFLHADPNFANFAFTADGRVIMYDFGCIKEIPEQVAEGYGMAARSLVAGDFNGIGEHLRRMGIRRLNGDALPEHILQDYGRVLAEPFRESPPYTFGEDADLYERLMELGRLHWMEGMDMEIPRHVIFIDRTINGHLGNLCKLRSTGPWRDILLRHTEPLAAASPPSTPDLSTAGRDAAS